MKISKYFGPILHRLAGFEESNKQILYNCTIGWPIPYFHEFAQSSNAVPSFGLLLLTKIAIKPIGNISIPSAIFAKKVRPRDTQPQEV